MVRPWSIRLKSRSQWYSRLIASPQNVPSMQRCTLASRAQRLREYLAAIADPHGGSLAA
jgi:hypothetical protein